MRAIRPMPDDFAQVAWTMSNRELQMKYHSTHGTINRWRNELGNDPRRNLDIVPADFAEQAAKLTATELLRHYQVNDKRIRRWCIQTCAEPAKYSRRQVPSDFADIAPTMHLNALLRHYHATAAVIKRWAEETGTQPAVSVWVAPMKRQTVFRGHAMTPSHRDMRQVSIYDTAADDIRRERFVVHRCDERGLYAEKGEFWRVGLSVLTPDELLMRAEKYRSKAA